MPIPRTESRISWTAKNGGVALKEKWGAVMKQKQQMSSVMIVLDIFLIMLDSAFFQ